jgi:hypothetical protein
MTRRREARGPGRRAGPGSLLLAIVLLAVTAALAGCSASGGAVPACNDPLRLAIMAQSVPGAAYVPCINVNGLQPGWEAAGFDPTQDGTSFLLNSDRSPGQPVTVRLTTGCQTSGASPSPPRAPGVLTYTRLDSISPRFAGTLYDVFPGGCVSYEFDFSHGSQIALMEQFEQAVGLYPRQQLRLVLKRELGVELNP